jgi:hypothetical protein
MKKVSAYQTIGGKRWLKMFQHSTWLIPESRSNTRQSVFIPSFICTQNGKLIYSFAPFGPYVFIQETGKQKILNYMVASIPGILSDLNIFVNVILVCYCYSETFECRHISKGCISYLRIVTSYFIVVKRKGTNLADSCGTVPLHALDCYWLQSGLFSSCQLSHIRPIAQLSRMICRIMWGVQNILQNNARETFLLQPMNPVTVRPWHDEYNANTVQEFCHNLFLQNIFQGRAIIPGLRSAHTDAGRGSEPDAIYCDYSGIWIHSHRSGTIPPRQRDCSFFFSVRCMQRFPASRVDFDNGDWTVSRVR